MIVSDRYRYVYIAIPKAGSQSVARWLVDHYSGFPVGYHHACSIPSAYEDYLVFTVVRDPYERCFSAWWFRCQEPTGENGNPMFGWSFDRFMHSVLSYRKNARAAAVGTAASMTQHEFAELSGARLAIRIETPEQLALLPFVESAQLPPLPRDNETRTKPAASFHDYFSGDQERLVWDYCADDFAAFGYPRRPRS